MRFGIAVFPGTWSDGDCYHVAKSVLGEDARYVWHKDTDLSDIDCVVLPGGFSYGDYLRTGAIARFSPVMEAVERFADAGGLVLGICNGFQILCEAGLLPGVLTRNHHVQFRCQWVDLRVESADTPFTSTCERGEVLRIPISHGEGSYYADPDTLAELNAGGRVVFRYCTTRRRSDDRRQPQRLAGEHSRHSQRKGQCARHDAPPGEVLRGRPWWNGRAPHLRVRARSHSVTGSQPTPACLSRSSAIAVSQSSRNG